MADRGTDDKGKSLENPKLLDITVSEIMDAPFPTVDDAQPAENVAKLLRGTKPHALPIEQATRVYLTVNLKSARQFGQTIPTALLHRADFVIE